MKWLWRWLGRLGIARPRMSEAWMREFERGVPR